MFGCEPIRKEARDKAALIIPTWNGGAGFRELLASLAGQAWRPPELLLLDSGSMDETVEAAKNAGFTVLPVCRAEFDHGATRQLGVDNTSGEIVVFMTQDAVLTDKDSLARLLQAFADPGVGAAYGRQVPRSGAGAYETHARCFNYPPRSYKVSSDDIPRLGLKTAFLSNSFAAYRREALDSIGGFPRRVIMGEDMIAGANLLLGGWQVAYCADATVYHSHAYTWLQEFRRYFDTGAMHSAQPWLLQEFGRATGEGLRFVQSELKFLLDTGKIHFVPAAILRTVAKYAGYRLGNCERWIPAKWKRHLSMNRGYWQ